MDEKPVTADVVVACLFAGVGAWGATVTVGPNPVYASELFGEGHAAISYPDGMTPMVMITIPGDLSTSADNPLTTAVETTRPAATTDGTDHNGEAEITISILGATFDGSVQGLEWDSDLSADTDDLDNDEDSDPDTPPTSTPVTTPGAATMNDFVPAPGTVASIVSGGRKGDSSITIKIEPVGAEDGDDRRVDRFQRIRFALPKLAGLQSLAGANITDDKKDNDEKTVWAQAESRIVSGAFTDALITGAPPHHVVPVLKARDSLTLAITPKAETKTIALKDEADKGLTAFKSVKEKNKDGYVELATVTVTTKQMAAAAMAAVKAEKRFTTDEDTPVTISTIAKPEEPATFHDLYDLDGEPIAEGLRGTLTVNAMGTRDLFNEDDMLFIDYDKNGKMGSGEAIAIDGNMGMGDALSVDPDKSDSFDAGGTGVFKVYYMPGGKGDINHGSMINLTAMVDYSDPTAIDEAPMKSATTLNFDGVTSDVDAYAIPFDGNGKGDKANVRVRCEAAAGCRVFLECWDDMGMRSFGEAGMIGGNALLTWDAMDIEGVIGVEEATSRHSCRILSAGMVKVQQLTRDGSSGTLVNNTYIGE